MGVAASLATAGTLSGHDVTVLLPAIYLMGNPVQNVGRCLGTAEVNAKYYPHIIGVCILNALLSIWVMQLLVR
ncbi:Inner membrane protein yjiG [Serratia fonticola]|uniref:Inner membrane protein yjiG n=1 Tax=Serratia fonticola TaxID=47917 RepID=A0A4U9VP75_SERFO|nr:Inner membrane protein yjiG [Serratia fonticola]